VSKTLDQLKGGGELQGPLDTDTHTNTTPTTGRGTTTIIRELGEQKQNMPKAFFEISL